MSVLTNKEILKLAKSDPTYKDITSKLTDEIFTDSGFEEMATGSQGTLLADFFGLSIRIVLQKIRTAEPRIPSVYDKVVEEYDNAYGGVFQRINTQPLKPTSPLYNNLQTGGSVDPFKIRKPETTERFYKQNFDWQNFLTIQKKELKKMFLSDGGINEYIDGITKSLDESLMISKYEVMRELMSHIVSDVNLQISQKIKVPEINQSATVDDLINFLQAVNSVYLMMDTSVMSKDFNKLKFMHGMNTDNYTLLIRGDITSDIIYRLERISMQTKNMGLKFDVVNVKDFGGLKYYDQSNVELKPVYDDFGSQIGFNTTGTGTPLSEDDIKIVDPNEKVEAVLLQRGIIFTTKQQPYEVESIYNPAGKYLNLWASQPNASFNIDSTYDAIIFEND